MNRSFHLFKMLIFPSFWGRAFSLAIKEHWIYIVVFTLIFNGSFLLRGEFMEFIISGALVAAVVGILFILYVAFLFIIKIFKEADFRLMVSNQPCMFVVCELLGIKNEEPQIMKCTSFSEELPDIPSKIGFTLMMIVSVSTIAGFLYLGYLVANQ